MIDVTVIIPVYRAARYLRRCLDSVRAQTLTELEIICIDDASPDESPAILDEYAERDGRIRVIRLAENRGPGYGRSLGLMQAAGKYVYFLDADDEIVPDALERLFAVSEKDALDGVFFDSETVTEPGTAGTGRWIYRAARERAYPDAVMTGEALFALFVRNDEWQVYVQRQFWRRDHLLRNGIAFDAGVIHEDEFFSMKAALAAGRLRYDRGRYLLRRIQAQSVTALKTPADDVRGYFAAYCGAQAYLSGRPHPAEAEINAAHLYELSVRFFRKMPDEFQKVNLFEGEALAREYAVFAGGLRSEALWGERFAERFSALSGYRTAALYGAGEVASAVYARMRAAGISVSRFLVTHADGNPERKHGRPVLPIDAYRQPEDEIVVVAMAEPAASDVSAHLTARAVRHFICTGASLSGPYGNAAEPGRADELPCAAEKAPAAGAGASDEIRVSVIIPVFEAEPYLRDCLDSVCRQTLRELEVICVDDASPDGCPQILDAYAQSDPRIRVFHLAENRRQGFGRNLGLRSARGKYVYFLDADDMIVPHAMETLYRAAEADCLDGIFFDSEAVCETEELRERFGASYAGLRTGDYPKGAADGPALAEMLWRNREWTVLVQRQFWKKEFLLREGIAFPEDAIHEDQFFSIAAALTAQRVRCLKEALFIRRFRENSVMTSEPGPESFHGYLVSAAMLLPYLRKKKISGGVADEMAEDLFRCMKRVHPVFRETNDPEKRFARQHLENLYTFYRLEDGLAEWERSHDEALFFPLFSWRSAVIYGAGKIGRSVYRRLLSVGIRAERFIVTERGENPETLFGREVAEIGNYEPSDGEIVLVAMAKGRHPAVSALLSARGIRHYLYADDVMTGPYGRA